MGALLAPLRWPLACVAAGALAVAYVGLGLLVPGRAAFALSGAEIAGMSLPLTVAWFAFSGACMLACERGGLGGVIAACSRFAGQACFVAGIPVWGYWYGHLVFGAV